MAGPFDLGGMGAVITGSSRGIGKAIAQALAAQGANVVVSSRKQAACDAVAAEIDSAGRGRAHAVAANIGDRDAIVELMTRARALLGQVDILVCNAATNPYFGPMRAISDEQFEKVLRNNILATHWLVQLAAPQMIERRAGSIVIIGSIGGYRGSSSIGAYNVSKAADFQLVRNLAVELGPHDVRVNCVAPGLIRTDFSRALWSDPANLERALAGTPLGRIGEPEDVAGAVVFLVSPAARYVTGQTLIVDGGTTVSPVGT